MRGGGSGTSPEPSTDVAAPPAEGPKDYGPPADSDAITLPCVSVSETIVLLNDVLMWA